MEKLCEILDKLLQCKNDKKAIKINHEHVHELVDSRLLDAHNGAGITHWCTLVPKKVNVFIWRLCKGGIPVKEVLYERGKDLDCRLCPKCDCDVESIKHCFLDCLISVRM